MSKLVGMSARENHCAFHSMSPPLLKAMAEELQKIMRSRMEEAG